jgi:cyanosortase A-associated protein
MIIQTQRRNYLLAITSISINLCLVYALVVPSVSDRSVADFEFPESFAGSNQIFASKTSNDNSQAEAKIEQIKTSQQYQTIQDGREIDLAISYLVGTRGDVETYLQDYTSIDAKAIKGKKIQQLDQIGYHALVTDNNRAYLTSCISPRSLSSVTQRQFSQQRYEHDLDWQIAFDWLRGKASIRDRRCLWVLLSTPVNQANSQTTEQVLETAWKDIYRWWLPNFPSLTNG